MIETSGERMVTITAETGPIELCYQTFGDRTDEPVVLIMGLGTQMTAWDDAFCATLAETGLFVVRFDNRDIGRSSRLDALGTPNIIVLTALAAIGRKLTVPYTLRHMAADTLQLMDHLGLATAHIVGASMGGAIAQELAIHHRGRLRTVTCIMSSTGDPKLRPPTPRALAVLMKAAPTTREGYIAAYKNTVSVLRGPHFSEDNEVDEARAIRNFERGLSGAGTTRQLAAIYASGNRSAGLATTSTPMLVIHGDGDPLIPVSHGHALVKAIGRATIDIIPHMGHTLPRAVWPRIIGDISQHIRSSGQS